MPSRPLPPLSYIPRPTARPPAIAIHRRDIDTIGQVATGAPPPSSAAAAAAPAGTGTHARARSKQHPELRSGHRRCRSGGSIDWLMIQLFRAQPQPAPGISRPMSASSLAWEWSMYDGGPNATEPSPIVWRHHVSANPDNIVQALDARPASPVEKKGRRTPPTAATPRAISRFQDKILSAPPTASRSRSMRAPPRMWTRRRQLERLRHQRSRRINARSPAWGCERHRPRRRSGLLHHRLRRYGRIIWRQLLAARDPGGETEQSSEMLGRRRYLDHRLVRSGFESHLLGRRSGEAVDAGEPRHARCRRRALHQLDARVASRHRTARVALPARAG